MCCAAVAEDESDAPKHDGGGVRLQRASTDEVGLGLASRRSSELEERVEGSYEVSLLSCRCIQSSTRRRLDHEPSRSWSRRLFCRMMLSHSQRTISSSTRSSAISWARPSSSAGSGPSPAASGAFAAVAPVLR